MDNGISRNQHEFYSIRQLQSYSGISEHTLRIWEKRYQIVVPHRSKGKMRLYNVNEVSVIMEVALLNHNGHKISKLARYNREERKYHINLLSTEFGVQQRTIYNLILSMFYMDFENFEIILDRYIERYGIDKALQYIIIPFMEKIRLFSFKESRIEIHFIVTILRKKIISGIEKIKYLFPANSARTALLFLPIQEHFDLILLYLAYLLKDAGWQVWYLGTNISMENLQSVLKIKQPSIILTYQYNNQKLDVENYKFYLQSFLNPLPLCIAVDDKELLMEHKNERFYFTELMDHLRSHYNS